MRIIHIWNIRSWSGQEEAPLITYCGTDLRDIPKVSSKGIHYAVTNIYRDEFVPDLCEECLKYEGAQMILLASTEL